MATFPLALTAILGKPLAYLIFLLIGFAFGFVLESSGFAHSPKLAAQFYFKDMTVLKVMFTGIIVAMVLIFASTALGWLDYRLIWVNPTYLWPGIVGGLIMGVGFIIGGFCPGTSLTALATLKLDGVFFVLGAFFGIFAFGETVETFTVWWHSSYMGRFTLPQLFGVETGWVVLGVVLMALFMFWGSEQLEKIFGGQDPKQAPKWRYYGAGALVVVALAIVMMGQPTTADRWAKIAPEKNFELDARTYQIEPIELLHTMHDHKLNLIMLDVRDEADYNMFHIMDAERISTEEIHNRIDEFIAEPANTVFVVMSNDEANATEVWKTLVAESVHNVYILGGGVNGWLDNFASDFEADFCGDVKTASNDELRYNFSAALGASCPAAYPPIEDYEEVEYSPKIQLELKRAPASGGCG
ncbi:MAG TPA: sulfurtransferase [Chloroflexi bacterium]|nr:sulfurtransferase [Chloroflexota bacterium]